mmetsp:Transcript_24512/g.46472  ORF Transcript_24512/g.46472 Transcript_24512/m.46472 type:complete len:250 (+) Transcript_24512:1744-2493(+)
MPLANRRAASNTQPASFTLACSRSAYKAARMPPSGSSNPCRTTVIMLSVSTVSAAAASLVRECTALRRTSCISSFIMSIRNSTAFSTISGVRRLSSHSASMAASRTSWNSSSRPCTNAPAAALLSRTPLESEDWVTSTSPVPSSVARPAAVPAVTCLESACISTAGSTAGRAARRATASARTLTAGSHAAPPSLLNTTSTSLVEPPRPALLPPVFVTRSGSSCAHRHITFTACTRTSSWSSSNALSADL